MICIINRENIPWLIEDSGCPLPDMVVVDELSSLRTICCVQSPMRKRSEIKRIVVLLEPCCKQPNGSVGSIQAPIRVTGSVGLSVVIGYHFVPDKRNGRSSIATNSVQVLKTKSIKQSKISPFHEGADHLAMPSLISTEVDVQLSESEKASYKKLKEELVLTLGDEQITAGNAASLSNKLLQMANGAVYIEDGDSVVIHDRKLDALEDLIEAANAKGVLVAYWFKHDLSRIEARLQSLKIHFTCIDSNESIRLWNEKKIQVGLIHPASAGHGLNLQNGAASIWFGLTWSLELYQQTVARCGDRVKIGNGGDPAFDQQGTIDERVIKALKEKAESQDALIEAVKAELGVNKK